MMAACPSQISIFAFPSKSKYSVEISKSKIHISAAVSPRATKLLLLNLLKLSPGVYGLPFKFLSCLVANWVWTQNGRMYINNNNPFASF